MARWPMISREPLSSIRRRGSMAHPAPLAGRVAIQRAGNGLIPPRLSMPRIAILQGANMAIPLRPHPQFVTSLSSNTLTVRKSILDIRALKILLETEFGNGSHNFVRHLLIDFFQTLFRAVFCFSS